MLNTIKRLFVEEEGQGMAEYGLILALVAIVVIGALVTLGEDIGDKLGDVSTELTEDRTTE